MPVITLTTDWGLRDYFAGAMKGDILSACPGATIVDISHLVNPFDLVHGAYIFRNAWHRFPEGTVHVVGLSAALTGTPSLIAVRHKGHYFLGANDGFFSLVFEETPESMFYVLDARGGKVIPETRALGESAAFLAKGGKIKDMGTPVDDYTVKSTLQPVTEEKIIRGTIIYVDAFGNLITNIHTDLFERIAKNREFDIVLRSKEYMINEISEHYFQVNRGNLLARFNESGFLEIAISQGNASTLLGLKYSDTVRIEFK